MPLVARGFLAVAPVPTDPLRSTPHPLPFGARSAAGLLLCASRWMQNPNIMRARNPFRIQPPDHVVPCALGGIELQTRRKLPSLCQPILWWLYVRKRRQTNYAGFNQRLLCDAASHFGTDPQTSRTLAGLEPNHLDGE